MKSVPEAVIVVAPQGTGKTQMAEALRRMFNCLHVIEEWNGEPVPFGSLILTNVLPSKEPQIIQESETTTRPGKQRQPCTY